MDIAQDAKRSLKYVVIEEVRSCLGRRGLSQSRAAERLGWTAFYLSHRMTGKVPFNVNDLEALAELLEVPVTAFFNSPEWNGVSVIGKRTMPSKSASGHRYGRADLACAA